MSDPLKMRQVCALVDELIETAQGSAQEESEALRQQVKGLEASLDLATHERNNLLETVAKQDAEIAELKQTCIDHVEIQNALREQVTLLRDCLKKIEARFDYGPRYGSVERTTLNDVVVALAATEH